MKYIKANGIYFQDNGSGIAQIVTDKSLLQSLNAGKIPYKAQSSLKGTALASIDDFIDSTMDSIVNSGKTIAPGLTDEDIASIDVKNFMEQAEKNIKKEFSQKFNVAKESLFQGLKDIDYDYATSITGIAREAKNARITGREDLAGKGLAFSSNRGEFENELNSAEERAKTASGETARRSALSFGQAAEGLLGTEYVRNLNLPKVGGTRYDSFYDNEITGSLNTDRTFAKNAEAKSLALDEANRRSFATRSLSFQ